jgi:hypothetical protein
MMMAHHAQTPAYLCVCRKPISWYQHNYARHDHMKQALDIQMRPSMTHAKLWYMSLIAFDFRWHDFVSYAYNAAPFQAGHYLLQACSHPAFLRALFPIETDPPINQCTVRSLRFHSLRSRQHLSEAPALATANRIPRHKKKNLPAACCLFEQPPSLENFTG